MTHLDVGLGMMETVNSILVPVDEMMMPMTNGLDPVLVVEMMTTTIATMIDPGRVVVTMTTKMKVVATDVAAVMPRTRTTMMIVPVAGVHPMVVTEPQ